MIFVTTVGESQTGSENIIKITRIFDGFLYAYIMELATTRNTVETVKSQKQ